MIAEVIAAVQRVVRVFPDEVPENIPLPYGYYSYTSTAIHTKDGIAGYEGVFSVAVVAKTKAKSTELSDQLIAALNGKSFGKVTLLYAESSESEFAETGLSAVELNFNYF